MKKLFFFFLMIVSTMTCLAQKFAQGEYIEYGYPFQFTFKNGRFTTMTMPGFPKLQGWNLYTLTWLKKYHSDLEPIVSETYTASNGRLYMTVTYCEGLTSEGYANLNRYYNFSYNSYSVRVGDETLYHDKLYKAHLARQEAERKRREEAERLAEEARLAAEYKAEIARLAALRKNCLLG